MTFQTQLASAANALPGLSTGHYLYINEACAVVAERGNNQLFYDALQNSSQHRAIIESCQFPDDPTDEARILRYSQSSSYLKALADRPAALRTTLGVMREATGLDFDADLLKAITPAEQIMLYKPIGADISRLVNQLGTAMQRFADSDALTPPKDKFEDTMDTMLPLAHWFIGGIMAFDAIDHCLQHHKSVDGAGMTWLSIIDVLFGCAESMLPWLKTNIAAITSINLAITIAKGESYQISDAPFDQIVSTCAVVDVCLKGLGSKLSQRPGPIRHVGRRALDINQEHIVPLVKHFDDIIQRTIAAKKR